MTMQKGRVLGKRILLADDQPGVREAVHMLLSLDGHTVVEAANGKEALEFFQTDRFDLIITDHAMPQMHGNELAVRIKQAAPAQPIIMITAYPERLGSSENPVDAILNKPFQLDDLRRAIARLLPEEEPG
jgi:two-component system cell cycle sensor histidine kinase/response regulator CckA